MVETLFKYLISLAICVGVFSGGYSNSGAPRQGFPKIDVL